MNLSFYNPRESILIDIYVWFLTSNRSCTLILVFVCRIEVKMGTYTTNYNLYMPTIGETGWGTLINGNISTIDTIMKSLSNRITTCESYGARIAAIENEVNGALSCTSVTASGKITGNGGIAGTTGTFSGAVTGTSFNGIPLKTSGTITVTPTSTYYTIPIAADDQSSPMILPFLPGTATYSGSIIVKMASGYSTTAVAYYTNNAYKRGISISAGGSYTISFTNAKWLRVCYDSASVTENCTISGFTLS